MSSTFCVIIPCYRHAGKLESVLARIAPFSLGVIVVDDGNDPQSQEIIQKACSAYKATLLKNKTNQGKGASVIKALRRAAAYGYTHALQLDSDGQHCIEDIPKFLKLSEQYPEALISGMPEYDASVPKARKYGRRITNFWVSIETLSRDLKESMCGFRVYPIGLTLDLIKKHRICPRMDFDIDILVRLYWAGIEIKYLKTSVTYPQDGYSNFNALTDNLRISLMHTKLCCQMPVHLGALLRRKRLKKSAPQSSEHWAEQKEVHGLLGMKIMLFLVKLGGRRLFSLVLYPVIAGYWLFAKEQRRASEQYLSMLKTYCSEKGLTLPCRVSTYRHFYSFGQTMLDKILGWQGKLKFGREVFYASEEDNATLNPDDSIPRLILGSHLGDIEAARALVHFSKRRVINALVFTDNAQRFKAIMDEVASDSGINLMAVNSLGVDTLELLDEKMARGEWVAILGDRIPVHPGRSGYRVSYAPFLGKRAPFPQGPYILASLLKCPVLMLHALREHGKIVIRCTKFEDRIVLKRSGREESLREYAEKYASELEKLTLSHPLDFFNFYNFWTEISGTESQAKDRK